jgi:hypothetical protein
VTALEAADALAAAQTVMRRSHHAAIGKFVRAPFIYWGCTWMVGYTAAQFLPGWLASLIWLACISGSFVVTHWARWDDAGRSIVFSGWEGQIRRARWALLLGSSALPFILEPIPPDRLYLMFGAFWGMVYMLYAIVSDDRALTLLGGGIVALAVILRLFLPDNALLLFGLLAGSSTLIFGIVRIRRQW